MCTLYYTLLCLWTKTCLVLPEAVVLPLSTEGLFALPRRFSLRFLLPLETLQYVPDHSTDKKIQRSVGADDIEHSVINTVTNRNDDRGGAYARTKDG